MRKYNVILQIEEVTENGFKAMTDPYPLKEFDSEEEANKFHDLITDNINNLMELIDDVNPKLVARPKRVYQGKTFYNEICKDSDWIAEPKKDGWRCVVKKENGKLKLWTRQGNLIRYPLCEIRKELQTFINGDFVLDSELLHTKGRQELWIFDVLVLYGQPMYFENYSVRRQLLEDLVKQSEYIRLVPKIIKAKNKFYSRAIANGEEGIVFKNVNSSYPFGETTEWIKCKP